MKEAHDHALERALREVVGGATPTDNTFQIVAAVRAARSRGPQGAGRPGRRARWVGISSGVAAAALALLVWLGGPEPLAPELDVRVQRGSVTWRQGATAWTRHMGESLVTTPHIGDRIDADPELDSRLQLRPFGTLAMTRGTRLEVEDMEWKEFGIGFGSGTITVAVLAGSITWFGDGATTAAASGDTSRLAMQTPAETAVRTAREKSLEADLAALQAKYEAARQAAARIPVPEEPAAAPEPKGDADPDAAFEPLADVPALRDMFSTADWRGVGESSIALNDLTRAMLEMLAAGEEVPREMLGELRRLGGIMQKYGALVTAQESIKGQNFETKVRSPIMGANWLHACLTVAGHPLDAAQRQTLATLSSRYAQEDEARRAAYADDVPKLKKYLDEIELQDRFYRDTRALLNKEQTGFVHAPKYQHRTGSSMIGEGSQAWAETVRSPRYSTQSDFVDSMSGVWSRALSLQGEGRQTVRRLVQRWIDDYPQEYWNKPMDRLDHWGHYEIERVRQSAKLQLRFLADLRRSLPLTAEQLKIIQSDLGITVPFKKQ